MIPREWMLMVLVGCCSVLAGQDDGRQKRKGANRIVDLEATCSRETFDIHIQMEKPFKGIVFSRDFSRECRAQGSLENDVTIHLPPNACGVRTTSLNSTVIQEPMPSGSDENEGLHYTVTLVIQMDKHLQQSSDQERTVKCWLKPNAMQIKSNVVEDMVGKIIKDIMSVKETASKKMRKGRMRSDWQQIPEEEQRSLMEHARAWMEIIPSNGNVESSSVEVGESTTLLIKSTLPSGIGMRITDCLAHDGIGEASQKLLDESGCPIDELIFPRMKVAEHKSKSDKEINFSQLTDTSLSMEELMDSSNVYKHIMAFKHASTTFAAFKFPDRARLHLSCTLELCKGECPTYDCSQLNIPQRTKEGLLRRARLDKDANGVIIDRLEVFNSIEVLAPNIELEDDASIRAKQTINGEEADFEDGLIPGDRTVCLSPSKMALAFCILGLVFLCALVVAFISLIRARRRYGQDAFRGPLSFYTGSKSLFSGSASTNSGYSGSKLLLTDSPCLDHHPPSTTANWPYGRVF